jgi:hypothetical protein
MDSAQFTFTFPLVPAEIPTLAPDVASSGLTTSFSTRASGTSGPRAEAQARYRARNAEAEREKARRHMQTLRNSRHDKVAERLRRQASSERLRATCVSWLI